jgi:hypothetical protein
MRLLTTATCVVVLHNSPQEPTAGFASLTRAAAQRQIR